MSDVFISHSSKDREIADIVCNALEANGISCWIAPRDIPGGADWSAAIADAIGASKVFIIIYSHNSAESSQVPRELALADSAHSHIIPYKVDDTELSAGYKYYLLSSHWVNANGAADHVNIEGLINAVKNALGGEANVNVTVNNVVINMPNNQGAQNVYSAGNFRADKPRKGKKIALIAGISAAVVALLAAVFFFLFSGGIIGGGSDNSDNSGGSSDVTSSRMDSDNDKNNSSESSSQSSSSEKPEAPDNSGGALTSPEDLRLVPVDIQPFENHKTWVFAKDPNESFTVLRKKYDTGLVLNAYDGSYVVFENSGDYDKLIFTIGRTDNTQRGKNTVRVALDGVEQKTIDGTADFMPTQCEYDITGVSKIKISIDQNYSCRAYYALMNMYFTKNGAMPEPPEAETGAKDLALSPVDKPPYENYKADILSDDANNSFKVLQRNYNTGIVLDAYEGSYIIFDNNEGYEKLNLTVGRLDNTARGDNRIYIVLDGEEQKSITGTANFMTEDCEYDISGVKQIKIGIDQNYSCRAKYALMNVYFSKNGEEPPMGGLTDTDTPASAAVPTEKSPYDWKDTTILSDNPNSEYTVAGAPLTTGIVLDAYKESKICFHNLEGYSKLSFTVSKTDNTAKGDNKLIVYLDGKAQKYITLTGAGEPQRIEYDISGCKQIVIYCEQNYNSRAKIALYDMKFEK